jgi:NAD(P)-dependent dehydrogenase (short-subunit alcohol dehydrogenase family)
MDKVALITGASRGLGSVIATQLGRLEYKLILTSRGDAELQAISKNLKAEGVSAHALAGDVSDPIHRQALVQIARDLGRLDILINNASELGPEPMLDLVEYPAGALERVLAVNLIAPLALVQIALPLLEASGGLIVNLSSDAARGGYPTWGGYGSSKAALDLASLTLANELRDSGVAVVSVDPGEIRTQMLQQANPGEDISDRPLPDVTIPFWMWLIGQPRRGVTGHRYEAQAEKWESDSEAE